jgi:hypothetical protein
VKHELPPDPQLQAALRHAPDVHLEAPPALAARVLAEARRAVAPAATPPWWARWWSRAGAGWVPQGAFATLLLAGLITLLWRDDRPGPAVESAPMAENTAPAAGPAAAPAIAELAAVASAPAAAPLAPAQDRATARERAAETARADAAQQAARQAKAADAAQAAKSERAERAERTERPEAAERRQETPPQLSPPPAPAPSPALPPAAPPVPAPATATAPAPAGAAMEAATRPLRQAPAAANPSRLALAAPESAPWGDPPGAADRLRRPGVAGRVDPVWLATIARSFASPWQDSATAPPTGEPLLVWEREGAPYGRLWVERREGRDWVLWCAAAAQTRCWQAPLRGEVPALPR